MPKTFTENNHPATHDLDVGDNLVALFNRLVRTAPIDSIETLFDKVVNDCKNDYNAITNLIVLILNTRDIEQGKGERDLFYSLI